MVLHGVLAACIFKIYTSKRASGKRTVSIGPLALRGAWWHSANRAQSAQGTCRVYKRSTAQTLQRQQSRAPERMEGAASALKARFSVGEYK